MTDRGLKHLKEPLQFVQEEIQNLLGLLTRHYGPGPHPGTSTSQDVHGGGKPTSFVDDPRFPRPIGWNPKSIKKEKKRLVDYMAKAYLPSSTVTAASWMAPDGTIYDVGRGGHQRSAINAFTKSGLWSEEQARASRHLGFHGPNEFVEYGFVRMYAFNDAKELGFEMSSPEELTYAQRERLAVEALRAYAKGWRVVAGHSDRRLDLRKRYSEEDIRNLLGIVARHYGPGPHPGTGTDQDVHGGGLSYSRDIPDKVLKDILGRLPKSWREGITIGYSAEDYRSTHRPHTLEITIAESDIYGLLQGTDLNNLRVALKGHEVGPTLVFDTPEEMTEHLSKQYIGHEVAHVLRDRMSSEQKKRLGKLAERFVHHIESKVVNEYRYYYEDRERDSDNALLAVSGKRRLLSEISSEVIRLYLTDEERFGKLPKTLRKEVEGIFGKSPIVTRHHGPGPHPGTGTSQDVHGGGGKTVRLPDDKQSLARLRKQAKERQAEGKFANVTRDPKTGEYMLITDRETAVEDTGDKIRNLNREQLYYFNAYELFYHKQGDSDSVDIDALEMGDLRGFGQEAHWHGDSMVSVHNHPPISGWIMPPSLSDLRVAALTFTHEMRVFTRDGDYIVQIDKFGKPAAIELGKAFREYNNEVLPELFPDLTKEMSPRAQRQYVKENDLYEELKQFQLDRLDAISEELPWVSYEYRPTN